MTLRHMIIFRAVCENGYNSTKAASALHITASCKPCHQRNRTILWGTAF